MSIFVRKLRLSLGRLLLSAMVGLSAGLSLYNFLLIRIYPVSSKRVLGITIVTCLAAAWVYLLVLKRWLTPAWMALKARDRLILALVSALLSLYLLVTGTSVWTSAPEVIPFLAPSQSLEIRVPVEKQPADADITVLYFATLAGEVSYDSIATSGWEKTEAGWHLVDMQDNFFRWTANTGGKTTLVFAHSTRGTHLDIVVNGESQPVDLGLGKAKVYVNAHFPFPAYAGRGTALLLVLALFVGITLPVSLWVWMSRAAISLAIEKALSPATQSPSQRANQIWIPVIFLMFLALLPRVVWLNREVFYVDELNHLTAAKSIMNGAVWSSVYQRSLLIVTLPVGIFTKLFGTEMWAARLPGVLFNVLAIIPLFLILDRVNRTAAVLGGLLFATNPWLVGVARAVREYAYYPFYFYWIIYGMITMIQQIPHGLVLVRDWKRLIHVRTLVTALLLLLALGYAAFDYGSTFRIIGIAYLVFFAFLIRRLDWTNKTNVVLSVAASGVILIVTVIYLRQQSDFFGWSGFNAYPLQYFLPNPPQQIFFNRPALLFSIALLVSAGLAILFVHKTLIPAFLAALLLSFGMMEFLFWGFYYRPRYFVSMQFWFLPLLGLGLWATWVVFRSAINVKPAAGIAAVLLLTLSVNPLQVLSSVYAEQSGSPTQVTGEFQYDIQPIDALLRNQATPGELLISNFYGRFVSWRNYPDLEIQIPSGDLAADSQSEALRQYVTTLVERNDSGWIILEGWSTWSGLPREDFSLAGKNVLYLGNVAGQMVWKWELIP